MTMATLTTDMYMLSRSHERKVLSLAQWSRASEDSLGKSNGANIGRERNKGEVGELSTVRKALLRQNINSLVYNDSLSAQRLKYLSQRRHCRCASPSLMSRREEHLFEWGPESFNRALKQPPAPGEFVG